MRNAKISLKHDNVHYINKNYVLNPIYNDENECIKDTLSAPTVFEKLDLLQTEILILPDSIRALTNLY